jgi:tRNA1Val (adenine37-N6)-methyltransferase
MMDDYSQPDFYRFNQDSILLINRIVQDVSEAVAILDLGAGSGIIGMELARKIKPKKLTLVEVQSAFEVHLNKNTFDFVPPETQIDIQIKSFADFAVCEKFDLIVCNPPYYLPGRGVISPNSSRAIARSFLVDSWDVLLKKVSEAMIENGKCFFVLKPDDGLLKIIYEKAQNCNLQLKHELNHDVMFLICQHRL